MIRFIIKHNFKHEHCGAETSAFQTIDAELPQLEEMLSRGGFGENGYDFCELVGVEFKQEVEKS